MWGLKLHTHPPLSTPVQVMLGLSRLHLELLHLKVWALEFLEETNSVTTLSLRTQPTQHPCLWVVTHWVRTFQQQPGSSVAGSPVPLSGVGGFCPILTPPMEVQLWELLTDRLFVGAPFTLLRVNKCPTAATVHRGTITCDSCSMTKHVTKHKDKQPRN